MQNTHDTISLVFVLLFFFLQDMEGRDMLCGGASVQSLQARPAGRKV